MNRRSDRFREPPDWSADPASGTVLEEYLKRASPEFVAAELDKLGLLDAADTIAAAKFTRMPVPRHARARLWVFALAMCAMIVVIAGTRHLGAMSVLPDNDGSHFMQLAGPTPEW
jgi:hypothetical protein